MTSYVHPVSKSWARINNLNQAAKVSFWVLCLPTLHSLSGEALENGLAV